MTRQLNLARYGLVEKDDGTIASEAISKNLKADDIGKPGKSALATILEVQEKTFEASEGPKTILTVSVPTVCDEARGLALNRTNLVTMVGTYGKDLDKWVNKMVELKIERTNYQGSQVPCIRIYEHD